MQSHSEMLNQKQTVTESITLSDMRMCVWTRMITYTLHPKQTKASNWKVEGNKLSASRPSSFRCLSTIGDACVRAVVLLIRERILIV